MSATVVHSLWTTAADPISKIDAPKIEYGQLSPTLIIIGAAIEVHRQTGPLVRVG